MTREGFKRKLTAILSADAKGYSYLMGEDEETTVRTLTTYREIISSLVIDHNGRVIDSPGDNILAEFSSVIDALRCAWDVQQEIKSRNNELPENVRMNFRIGINLGDVIEEGDRIYGDGVNIAARLEGLAEGGGICISGAAYDQVKNKLPFRYVYDGEQAVKNIKEPVRVYRVLTTSEYAGKVLIKKERTLTKKWLWLAASIIFLLLITFSGLYWKYYYLPTPIDLDPENKMAFELPTGPSIAVLPFLNMTGDQKQEVFCDGISENLIATLAQVPRLFVISRISSFTYKAKKIKIQQIGNELGVKYVIEGSVQKSNDTIRITVQLVETNSGSHIWSDIYDRKLEDIFRLQDEIVLEILKAMQITLTEGEKVRGRFEGVNDLNLWLKMSKADNLRFQMNPMSNHLARKEAYEIIDINPNLSLAYNILGFTYLMDLWFDTCDTPLICFGKATEAVRKALQLDPNSSDAHGLAAYLFSLRRETENAIAEVKKAINLSPNNADAYLCFGLILNWAERPDKGKEFINKAIKLNPIPNSYYLNALGNSFNMLGDYKNAINCYKQALKLDPNLAFAYSSLVFAYIQLGLDSEAKQAARELLKIRPNFSVNAFIEVIPLKNQNTLDLMAESLQKAGLPD